MAYSKQRHSKVSSTVPEIERIKLDDLINRFYSNPETTDFTFPPSLSNLDRAYVHGQAGKLGLKTQSSGNGKDRRITISKTLETVRKIIKSLELTSVSVNMIQSLEAERAEILNMPVLEQRPKKFNPTDEDRHKFPPERSGFTNRIFTEPSPKIPNLRKTNYYEASRKRLPIFGFRDKILNTIDNHSVIFIKGDTGCGKTTQVPQYILENAAFRKEKVRILCTVPRRIAAISISDRVATERGEKVGYTVGYQIRLESCISPIHTLLTYCTSGVLLRSLTSFDYSILKRTTHIIIDEIHERDRQTEFLLACLRDLGREFPHLKLILMGADMDIGLMTSYFGGEANCPLIEVRGRLFPVKIFFLEDVLSLIQYEVDPRNRRSQYQGPPPADVNLEDLRLSRYQNAVDPDRVDLQLIVKLLYNVHINNQFQEAVLIFLPGYEEIVTLKQMIFCDPDLGNLSNEIVVFLLHSNIQTGDQRAVFERPRNGARRKIVLSTNIAETSLTIEDIVYVIDAGKVKEKTIDSFTGVTQLKSNWISQASANQRQGRAGRCRPGICYRMYSYTRYESMNAFPIAEIVRSSLQELCLYTRSFIRKELRIADFFKRLPEPPAPIAVKKSVDALVTMGALDRNEQLTKMGLYLLDLPIEPFLGKALMYAVTLKCLDPILTIITLISHREPFQLPSNADDKKRALESKIDFASNTLSDHMASLKAFLEWEKSTLFKDRIQRQFCFNHYLSSACFEMVYGIRAQLLGQLRAAGFVQNTGPGDLKDINSNSGNWALVKGILVSTLYPKVCAIDKHNKCLYNEFDTKVKFHNSTVMGCQSGIIPILPPDWIIYDEMCQQDFSKCIRGCTIVNDVSLVLFGGDFALSPYAYSCSMNANTGNDEEIIDPNTLQQSERFDLNSWITFRGNKMVVDCLLYLRKRLQELLMKRLKAPAYIASDEDENAVKILVEVMSIEDEGRGFVQVKGIDQWPKLVSGNMMSTPRTGFERSQAIGDDDKDAPTPGVLRVQRPF